MCNLKEKMFPALKKTESLQKWLKLHNSERSKVKASNKAEEA